MAEELFTRPKQGFASRGDVRKKDQKPELVEKDMSDAPVWYDSAEAAAWASGYNCAVDDLS